jgi:hypothetical protein
MRARTILGFLLVLFVSVWGVECALAATARDVMTDANSTWVAGGHHLRVQAPLVFSGTTATSLTDVCVSGDMMYDAAVTPAKAIGNVPEGKRFGVVILDVDPVGNPLVREYRPVDLPTCSTTAVESAADAKKASK